MAFGGDYKDNFYSGADYGFDPKITSDYAISGFGMPGGSYHSAGNFAVVTDPRTSNQIQEVSKKLSTGAKTIEVSGVSAAQLENIPEQHLDEINRLRKLAQVDLTFHGPLVEPTGVTTQGWNESHREQAERQMWSSMERAHKMDPDGNINITFHSSNGLPDPITKVKTKVVDPKTGKEKEIEQIKGYWVVNKVNGQFNSFSPTPNFFRSDEGKLLEDIDKQQDAIKDAIEKQNKETWFKQLQSVSFHASQGSDIVRNALYGRESDSLKFQPDVKKTLKLYENYVNGEAEAQQASEKNEEAKESFRRIAHGDIYLRDAYQDLQNAFNMAYEAAKLNDKKEDLERLDAYRKKLKPLLKDIENPSQMEKFSDMILEGVNVLRSVKPPEVLQPLQDFGVEQSAKTFANMAYKAYDKFGKTAPIVSIENPPAGSALSRAEDLRDIVKTARANLQKRLVKEKHLNEKEAEKQAEKLIGVTWDVGHINMLRKYGYDKEDIVQQTKEVAKYVNKIHLSDNFGLEHTELPMGMGNVPTKPMIEAIEKYNKNLKKIIETGTWFGPQAFGNAYPLKESLRAFGSPIYSMQMAPTWGAVADTYAGYFTGFGQMLPQQHFSMYGAGFSNLPPELGGQLGGQSRASGAPIE